APPTPARTARIDAHPRRCPVCLVALEATPKDYINAEAQSRGSKRPVARKGAALFASGRAVSVDETTGGPLPMEQKTPNRCPDDAYVEQRLFELLKRQMDDGNAGAVKAGGVFRYANRRAFAKLLAHYEIFKLVETVPGHILELGVFKGESLLRFAQLAEIFLPYDRSFEIIGFDNFAGFPALHEKDGPR